MVDNVLVPSEDTKKRCAYVTQFMEEHVYSNERVLARSTTPEAQALQKELQGINKANGYWAPHLPSEAGGMGVGFLTYAYMNEIIGRSGQAPSLFGSQAPDSGNAEILHQYGTSEQKDKYLAPLVNGDVRSCFSMTEPAVSGADPTGLETTAVREGDEWVINGRKWFSSGAIGATFAIVMAKTDPEAPPHSRFSQILVPTDTPGFNVERKVEVWGDPESNHPVIRYEDCRVPVTNLLGPQGMGFKLSQRRLGPGRIHHCMRALGQAQRAFDLLCTRAIDRHAFGGPIADKQTVQNWIADSLVNIQAARLLTMQAAQKIDSGDEARVEVSMIKFFVVNVTCEVIDKAIQVHGAMGVTTDTPLQAMYKQARILRIADGPDEVHRMVVSRAALRKYRQGDVWDFQSF
ncbi:MAG TPA: acyl-CoA dehydrogenase family protein [Dehalococcoidia bacterium]|nr:acyl-CoA dehydrogenase family protein [Dehalococcoidia bacterium]